MSALVLAVLSITPSNAQEINLGGFVGNVSTVVTHGVAIRAEDNNCMLVSGSANDQTAAMKALIGGTPYKGNGGCNYKRDDGVSHTTTGRDISIGSVASDDGRLNFQQGDVIDAGQTVAVSFFGDNASGIRLSLSGVAMVNPLLDINDVAFKALSSGAEDHLESDFKLGNAYISAPLAPNVDLTLGNYVQSQGISALFPIGVNVVNSVSLPILRSPGAQLKDALLPQAMIGASMYLDGGVTLDAYYQLEQKEIELDAAGTFFGSDLVGVGNRTGIISAANVNEDATAPIDNNYFNVAECVKGVSISDLAANATDGLCDKDTSNHLFAAGVDGWSVFHDVQNTFYGSGYASNGLAGQVGVLGSIGAVFQTVVNGAVSESGLKNIYDAMPGHASSANTTLTDTNVRDAFTRLYSQYPGQGDMPGLLYVRRAPDSLAKDSGQFGLNMTGYADNIGQGVDWGLYYNNSHSNSPRIRMLAITNGYATDMFASLNNLVTATASGGLNQYDLTNGTVTDTETAIGAITAGPSVCFLINATTGAFQGGNGVGAATHLHDPSICMKAQAGADALGGAAAAAAGTAAIRGASIGAMATLSFANAGRYQLYYPEDIETFGASLSTNVKGWAVSGELAYRPDFPMQIAPSDLTMNLIDSTYGTAVQSTVAYMAVSALGPMVAGTKWSAAPTCDISSATGTASTEMSGYSVCDGTAEFDAITATANFIKTFTASDPFVQNAGADGGSLLIDLGYVGVPDINYAQGVVASGQFQGTHDVYQNGCNNAGGTYALSIQSNGLFGDDYCETDAGPDSAAFAYKIRGSLTYNNFNNSPWSFSPSIGFNHDLVGNAPSSLGGFVEDRMSASATARFTNGGMTTSVSYQMEMGDELVNSSTDKDYLSANFSYAF